MTVTTADVIVFTYLMMGSVGGAIPEVAERTDTVIGVEGEKVNLPCNITPPSQEDEVALVLWYKDESTTPLYSLDSRRRGLYQAKHAPGNDVAGRAYLVMTDNPSLLRLEGLRADDEGEYRCRVDFRIARSRNVLVILEIITPPKTPIIRNDNGEFLQRVSGPHTVGTRLTLSCEVEGGKPPPSVTWWRDSVMLDDSYQFLPKGAVKNDLIVPSLDRSDLHAVFTCQASNNNVSGPVSSSVTIDMNLPPVEVQLGDKQRALSANKAVELVCRAGGSRPPANITWTIGRIPLKGSKAKISSEGNITTGKLTFVPNIEDGGKNISCRAENSLLPGSGIVDVWTIDVHYVPQLTLRLGSKLRHSHIQEGKDVYLECAIVSNPPVIDVGWRFEGRELHTNKSAGIIVSSQSLVLQQVRRTNRGRYTCMADNAEGHGESAPLYLRVQYSPICKAGQKTLYGVARHEPVKVTCDVEADPSKTNFTWKFNNSVESLEIMTFASDETRSTATYIPRTEYDYGTLLCWGKNFVGAQKDPCVFTVIPAGPPDAVQNCSSTNETEESWMVRCQEGYDGGLQQEFFLEVFDSDHLTMVTNMTSPVPIFGAYDLPPGTAFVAVVYAFNSKGRSKGTVVKANTLATPESLTQRDDPWQGTFSPVLIVLICVVVVLVLVAITILLIVKARSRHHSPKKDPQKQGNDKSMTPLRQDVDERREMMLRATIIEAEDRCPDVIPGVEISSSESMKDEDGTHRPDIQGDNLSRDTLLMRSSNSPPPPLNGMDYSGNWSMHHRPLLKQVPSPSVPPLSQKSFQPLHDYTSPTQQRLPSPPGSMSASSSSSALRDEWTLPRTTAKVKNNRQTDV